MKKYWLVFCCIVGCLLFFMSKTATAQECRGPDTNPKFDNKSNVADERSLREGKRIFRYDTFGSEVYWGDTLRLHEAIAGQANGGVGPGLSPRSALALGLKVDVDALPKNLINQLRRGQVNLDDPATTLALLKLDAVVGVKGFFDRHGAIKSI